MRINITILFFCLFSWCQPAFAQKITFALLTDLHVNPNSPSDTALHHMVDEINSSQLDFVVVSGDLTNTGSNAELDAVKNSLSALHIPCYVIPGNHETNWSESAGMHFLKLFGNDRFLIRKNGFLLVGFNTGPFMKMGDGIVKQEDLRWLNQELAKTKTNNETLIAFSHYPLAEGLSNWAQVTEILKKNNCRLSFCGHGHHLALFNFDGIPGIMGRAMLMQNNQLAGYNIVELRDDSVFVSQKELGQKKELSLFHFNYLKSEGLDSLPKSQNSDIILNKQYPDIKVAFSLQDSASIFAGPCVANNKILIYCNSLGKVKAVELKSKKLIWQKELHKPIYSTPVCGNRVVILGTLAGEIIGIDIRNGNQLWKINVGTPVLA